MIGSGKERGGLYHLILHDLEGFCDSSVPVLAPLSASKKRPFNYVASNLHFINSVDVFANVLHSRLGHLSDSRIHLLHHVILGCS